MNDEDFLEGVEVDFGDESEVYMHSHPSRLSPKRRKARNELSLSDKLHVIGYRDDGAGRLMLKNKFRVSRPVTTRTLQEKRDVISGPRRERQIRQRRDKYDDVNKCLYDWFSSMQSYGKSVRDIDLLAKAKEFTLWLGHVNFEPDVAWIQQWKESNNITTDRILKVILAKLDQTDYTSPSLDQYSPEDIYAVSEVALHCNAMPENLLTNDLSQEKNQQLTAIIACNQTATDKCQLLVLGESPLPAGACSLPCVYVENCYRSWMTSVLFVDWLMAFNADMKSIERNVLLVLDSSPVHPVEVHKDLTNVKLKFIDKDSCKFKNPCSAFISKKFKLSYKSELLRRIMLNIHQNNLIDSLHMMSKAWKNVDSESIQYSFAKAGFESNTSIAKPTLGDLPGMTKAESDEYLNQDRNLPCYGLKSIQQICLDSQPPSEEVSSAKRNLNTKAARISCEEVLSSIDNLRGFLQSSHTADLSKLQAVHCRIQEIQNEKNFATQII